MNNRIFLKISAIQLELFCLTKGLGGEELYIPIIKATKIKERSEKW